MQDSTSLEIIDQRDRIDQRITDYLSTGGLFNPEMADHRKVRDLLIDIRDYMANCSVVKVSAENDMLDSLRVGDARDL